MVRTAMTQRVEQDSESPLTPTSLEGDRRVVYKVVLTGGPCAGKTTTLARLRTFFENLGWKVYTVPEAATILLGGGVKWSQITPWQAERFQENIVRTILQLERTFFEMAEGDSARNVLVACDRGALDPSAFCSEEQWQEVMAAVGCESNQLRDERYDQVIHMVTAASGAEPFYQLSNNSSRSEGLESARLNDSRAAHAWLGHPYLDVIDNTTDFEQKVRRVIEMVCRRMGKRLGVDIDDRLQAQSRKRKFLIKSLPDVEVFPKVQDFDVQHDYLLTSGAETRIRRRGQNGFYTYAVTERRVVNSETVEQIMQLSKREYLMLYKQRDPAHNAIHKTRRCFIWKGHYFQLDIFKEPWSARCVGLLLLETYTTKTGAELELPDFLLVEREVTRQPHYSMYFLSEGGTD